MDPSLEPAETSDCEEKMKTNFWWYSDAYTPPMKYEQWYESHQTRKAKRQDLGDSMDNLTYQENSTGQTNLCGSGDEQLHDPNDELTGAFAKLSLDMDLSPKEKIGITDFKMLQYKVQTKDSDAASKVKGNQIKIAKPSRIPRRNGKQIGFCSGSQAKKYATTKLNPISKLPRPIPKVIQDQE